MSFSVVVACLIMAHICVYWHGGQCLRRLVPSYAVVFRLGWVYLPVSLKNLIYLVLMAFFCAAITRELVFLLRFPFVAMYRSSHVRSREFVAWNIRTVVFLLISFSLLFIVRLVFMLSVLLLAVVISLSSFKGNLRVITCLSSLGYKALCIVINFLVLWSISLSSSLDHF